MASQNIVIMESIIQVSEVRGALSPILAITAMVTSQVILASMVKEAQKPTLDLQQNPWLTLKPIPLISTAVVGSTVTQE